MDEKRIIGLAVNDKYARWAHKETNPDNVSHKPEALNDMLVLDASYGSFAGLFASSILAEMGAEVIRIEPSGGDIARKMTPYGITIKGSGLPYIVEGRNKYHITLDFTKDEGKRAFKKLIKKADVLIEIFKPGYLDSIALGYRQVSKINPGLIYCAIHSYGHFGSTAEKCRNQPDYDIISQARGVIMSITGEPELDPELPAAYNKPLKHGNWMGWYAGGAWATLGINAAMVYKRKIGKGQFIDTSPPEGLMAMSNYVMQYFHASGKQMPRAGNYDYAVFPYTYEKCQDGYAFIGAYTDSSWAGLCDIMNRPDLQKRFPTPKERLVPENQPIIQHEIEQFTTRYTSEELLQMITEYSRRPDKKGVVVMGRLESPKDVLTRDHWKDRNTFITLHRMFQAKIPHISNYYI
jgi:crotonobetainyl-CoA:carnitine CoA-transferase CaiB-like acyl-CoA transferase